MRHIKENKILFWILGLSFVVTLAYAFYFRIHPVVDAKAYDRIAQNLLAGNGFVEDASVDIKYDQAITRVGPLYQFMLAGIFAVFGHHYEPVWILQAFLHVLSAYFVYLTAKIIFKEKEKQEKISLLSAGIFAFYPDLIEISAMLMTETVYIFFWCVMIWYFFKIISEMEAPKKLTQKIIVLGILSGFAVLARPPVLFVLPAVFVYFLARKKYVLSVIFFVTLAIVFTPWTVRNYAVYHKIMPVGAAGAWNFWIGNHEGGKGEQEATPEMVEYMEKYGVISLQDESMAQFKKFVFAHPFDFVRLTVWRVNKYFSVARPMGFWFYDSGLSQMLFVLSSACASAVLFVFALYTAIKLWIEKNKTPVRYLFAFTILTPLILFITVVETRYRFQIYPLLAIFAGFGLISLFSQKTWWKDKVFLISLAIILLNAIIDLSFSLDRLQKLGILS